jgi:hypothetical protein
MNKKLQNAVIELAERQHGVFALRQLLDAGFTYEQARRSVVQDRWRRRYEGVFMLAGVPTSWKAEVLAACFAGGRHTYASHRSAAALFEFPGGATELVEITCPRWRRAKEEGFVVHESKALDCDDCTVVDNIPLTSPELTLLMLGAVCSPLTVEMALDVALRRELVAYESTRALLERLGRRGRNGTGVLRTILDERVPERAIPESPMETRLLRLLRDLGFPRPVPQYEVWHGKTLVGRVDAAYPNAKVALEYQSIEHHTGAIALLRDNDRWKRFHRIGWDIIGVTIEDLRNRGLLLQPRLWDALRRAS